MSVLNKSPITINEARKILGKEAGLLSDGQVLEIIDTLKLLASEYLRKSGSKKSSGIVKLN